MREKYTGRIRVPGRWDSRGHRMLVTLGALDVLPSSSTEMIKTEPC